MSTITKYNIDDINSKNKNFNSIRSTIETAFYGNNVVNVNSANEAYKLAYDSP
jgi:phosphoenolpyruvate carboxykinase (ATP)